MTRRGRLLGLWVVLGVVLLALGCAAQDTTTLPESRDTPLISVPDGPVTRNAVRSQAPEPPPEPSVSRVPPAVSVAQLSPNSLGPPRAPAVAPTGPQTGTEGRFAVQVCAWVNNKPIFDDEVRNRIPPDLPNQLKSVPPDQRDEVVQGLLKRILDDLVDKELLRQDAFERLAKNPKYMEKMKKQAEKETDKKINAIITGMKLPSREAFKEMLLSKGSSEECFRSQMEREFISSEYLKVMIFPLLQEHVNHEVIRDFYDTHLNEFQNVDRVQWHDVFIAIGSKHPTLEQARQFAKQVVVQWQHGTDIAKLMEYDDGDSKFRKGMGAGELRGDIKPAELEPYLFNMKAGEIGPLVDIATGVHVFRLVKREVAGLMPFDEKVQTMIGNKLKGDMFERESRRIVHDLREKAKAAGNLVIVERPKD